MNIDIVNERNFVMRLRRRFWDTCQSAEYNNNYNSCILHLAFSESEANCILIATCIGNAKDVILIYPRKV